MESWRGASLQVLVIGSDVPSMTSEVLEQALAALGQHEMVLGPAVDGGFYLAGITRLVPAFLQVWCPHPVLSAAVTRDIGSSHVSHNRHLCILEPGASRGRSAMCASHCTCFANDCCRFCCSGNHLEHARCISAYHAASATAWVHSCTARHPASPARYRQHSGGSEPTQLFDLFLILKNSAS